MKFLNLQQTLNDRADSHLLRDRKIIDSAQSTQLKVQDQMFVNSSSNDYLGLANSDVAKQAMAESVQQYGFGSGGSHLICGHQKPHQLLEDALAKFVKRDAALTFSRGYLANLAILQALAKKGDVIIADK